LHAVVHLIICATKSQCYLFKE